MGTIAASFPIAIGAMQSGEPSDRAT